MPRIPLLLLFAALAAAAQTISSGSIQASGNATIAVTPDQATLSAGVVTQAATAQDAANQNATLTDAMIAKLKGVLGTKGSIQTLYYSISPRYSNTQPPTIVGYTVTNTVQVLSTDVNLVGPLIDAANAAGGNNINGPSFGLQNPEPV